MTHIARLDYARADIKMIASTQIERSFRIHACAKEPWTVAWIESFPPNSVLYDVGACVGSYTLLAAALGHTVVAIEPSFANYARLCENILLNELGDKILPLYLAAGPQGGVMPVMEQALEPGYSGGDKRLRVPLLPLASIPALFGCPSPTHVKIDVDGFEVEVLRGCAGLGLSVSQYLVEVNDKNKGLNLEGYTLKERYDTRNGQKIQGMEMQLWERV